MNTNLNTPHDYLAIVKRRRWYLILPAVVLGIASILVALLLPPVYRSAAKILIEQPDIPPELVASTVTSYASERLQVIEQRVTTSENLTRIINKYNLYPNNRQYQPVSKLVEKMRDSSGLELISATGSNRPGSAPTTIAFGVYFDYDNPQIAQRVANELVSLYLSENIRTRQDRAAETTAFLAAEADRLDRQISENEAKFADMRQRYAGSLPGQMESTQQIITRTEADIRALDQRAESIKQGLVFLQAQLAQVEPYRTAADGGLSMSDRLRELRAELVMLSARYRPNHPTLVQLREEAAALEKAVGGGTDVDGLREQRDRLQMELALAKQRYTAEHPEVVELQNRVEEIEGQIFQAQRQQNGSLREGVPPDNLAYIQLEAQVTSSKAELESIAQERQRLKESLTELEKRIEQAPEVEREYQRLARAHEAALNERRTIAQKLTTAQLGETLETERKGERFTLIEPPYAPTEPIKPRRVLIVTLGLLMSLGAGLAAAVLAEALDTAVHGPTQLASITGFAPLATIPYIETRKEIYRRWQKRVGFAVGSIGILAGLIVSVHLYVSPIDVLWARLERGVEMSVLPLAGN